MNQREIAKAMGVSQSTVSLVMSDHGTHHVSTEMRLRIMDFAGKVNYHVRPQVQALKHVVMLINGIPDLSDSYYQAYQQGVEAQAAAHDIELSIKSHRGDIEQTLDRMPQKSGLILQQFFQEKDISQASARFPTMLLNYMPPLDTPPCDLVIPDFQSMMRLALGHLKERGHRRICFWALQPKGGVNASWHLRETVNAFISSMRNLDLDGEGSIILPVAVERTREEIRREFVKTLEANLKLERPFTAFISHGYIYALEMPGAAASLGVKIPEKIAVIGCDNVEASAYSNPPLTCANYDRHEMGRQAIDALILRAQDRSRPPKTILCPPTLIIRGST